MKILSNQVQWTEVILSEWNKFISMSSYDFFQTDVIYKQNLGGRSLYIDEYRKLPLSYNLTVYNEKLQTGIRYKWGSEKKVLNIYRNIKDKKTTYFFAAKNYQLGLSENVKKIGSTVIHNRKLRINDRLPKYLKFYILPITIGSDYEEPSNKIKRNNVAWVLTSYSSTLMDSNTKILYVWMFANGDNVPFKNRHIYITEDITKWYAGKLITKDIYHISRTQMRGTDNILNYIKNSGLI